MLALALIGQLATESVGQAHYDNWKWITNTPEYRNATTDYGSNISSAAAHINTYTEATIYVCHTEGCENWLHTQTDAGQTGYYAISTIRATVEIGDEDIFEVDTVWNEYYTSGNDDHVAAHEVGHGLGFDHVECSTSSVMWETCSTPWPVSVTSHDITDIDNVY